MWIYSQIDGKLYNSEGSLIAVGYAGNGEGKNNPSMEGFRNTGPLPVGLYRMGAAINHPKLGPISIPLIPDAGNCMYGRSDFLAHGDSLEHPGEASLGCIILNRVARGLLSKTADRWLMVVHRWDDLNFTEKK